MRQEGAARTLLIAAGVALACSALVAGTVYLLRPIQNAYQLLDRNRALLQAAGMLAADADDRMVVSAYLDLDVRLVDLTSDSMVTTAAVPDVRSYDHWSLTENSPAELRMQEANAAPGPPPHPRYVPVYVVRKDSALQRLILPVHGQGMWSTIHGYLALADDLRTVAALTIYRHGETPGIGDRIEDAQWLRSWSGKQVYADDGSVRIDVVRQAADSAHEVDLISGASVTSKSVASMVRSWMGPQGYGPLLDRLRENPDLIEQAGRAD